VFFLFFDILLVPPRPIHWQYDHALRLWPMPDLLVLADRTDQYSWRYEDCLVLNPGPFTADFSFVVYRPASFETEFSRV
jgi:DNA polymerase epsilon subunit 2